MPTCFSPGILTLRRQCADMLCRVYWGSHGCDLARGHKSPHVCGSEDEEGPCSQAYDAGVVRYWEYVLLNRFTPDPSVPPTLSRPYLSELYGEDIKYQKR